MKKFIVLIALAASSLTVFSCTTDDSDLVEETVIETEVDTFAGSGHGHFPDDRDPD